MTTGFDSVTLETITHLSHEFGTADYVKAGGGNTSAKNTKTLWVKPSGITLAGLTPTSFVAMDRAKLAALYRVQVPADAKQREAVVKDLMAAAVLPGQTARPSVEAPLHDVLSGTFVVHTHPALVNGLTCSRQGREVCARLFPTALWVPYIDPGYTLCMDVRQRVLDYTRQHGQQPSVLVLENHGVFVSGNSPAEIRAIYRQILDTLSAAYDQAGISTELPVPAAADAAAVAAMQRALQEAVGEEAAVVTYGGQLAAATGPLSPDHIVYAKSFPHDGPVTRAGVEAFRARRGYTPLVYLTPAGVFAIGASQKKAALALELALDGALVLQLTAAFGGVQYMSDRAREFIEQWEVESYRQKQMA